MNTIEDYNRQITSCNSFRIEKDDTVRGGTNHRLIESLRSYYQQHGFASDKDYQVASFNRKMKEQQINEMFKTI